MVLSSQASGDAAAGQISGDRSKWQHEVVFEFAQRWASKDLQTRAVLNDLIAATEGAILDISVTELFDALDVIKPSSRLDDDGLTPDVLRVIGFTCPLLVIHIVQSLLASRKAVERCVIVAQIKGKLSSTTAARDVRAILPLPAILALCDCIVARKLESYVDLLLPNDPTYFAGALKGTQTSDVVFPVVLAIEKGLDFHNQGAAAIADIKCYYDLLSPLFLYRWLCSRGVPAILATAFLRIHILPAIRVRFDAVDFIMPLRTRGVLTGTRTANVAARIPVGDVCQSLAPQLERLGFSTPSGSHAVSSWIDNLTSLARTADNATFILDLIRDHLQSRWRLDYKPTSMELLSVEPLEELIYNGYLVKKGIELLGHRSLCLCFGDSGFSVA